MGLFSRKEEVPEIPLGPHLPDLPRKNEGRPSNLPSIPSSENDGNNNLNEEMIKSAINDNNSDSFDYEEEEDLSKKFGREKYIPNPPSNYPVVQREQPMTKKETIFVKIEKFKKSQETLKEVDLRVKELSEELKVLRESKLNEIKEIDLWDDELKKINMRLSRIDSSIFGEV